MSTGAGPLFGSNQFQLPSMGGSNQWMSYPSLPQGGMNAYSGTETSPFSTNPFSGMSTSSVVSTPATGVGPNTVGNSNYVGQGYYEAPTYDPGFSSSVFAQLQSLLGGGGNLQEQLLSFLSGGATTIPGASSLLSMANTGNPISALPEWQQMLTAQGQNIAQNEANLKEQFAFSGDLQSSPFGTAVSNYEQQTTKDQNALLAQMQTQALENAMQRELSASGTLTGLAGNETQFLDQLFASMATASPNLFKKGSSSILGGLGSLIGGLGGAAGGIGDLLGSLGGGAAAGGAAAGGADLAALLATI